MTSYLGIDPGLSGGFAVISSDKIVCKMVMPTISHKNKAGKTKTEIDRGGVLSFLSTIPPYTHVVIEEVRAYRKQDITATCTTCKNYGMLLMALTVTHMYISEVPSDVWQKHFGIFSAKKAGDKSTKEQAFDILHMIYPNEDFRKSDRSHTFHDGVVDATLIAKYSQSLFTPSPDVIEPLEVKPIPDVAGTIKPLECKPGGVQPICSYRFECKSNSFGCCRCFKRGKMTTEKVKEIQEYLETKEIVVAETTIIDAAIKIATRWGGNWAFVCELRKEKK